MGRQLRARTCRVAAVTSLSLVCAAAPAFADVRTVLGIHWGPADFPTTPIVNAAIRRTFAGSRVPVDYFPEYIDVSERLPVERAARALADAIRSKYRGRRIDLVIAVSNVSLQFALDWRDKLFPGVPIVFSGAPALDDAALSARHLTGIRVGSDYAETLKLALAMHPSTQRVFVVATSPVQASVDGVRRALRPYSSRVPLTYIAEDSLPRLLESIKAIPPHSLVLYVWHWQEDPGTFAFADTFAPLVAAVSPVPVYGTNEMYLGTGVVGGMVRSTSEHGQRLAELAMRVLDGSPVENMPIERPRLVPTFDWRQMMRWGIDPSRLPPDADVRFREPGAWAVYRWYIIATFAVIAAQLLAIAGLLTQRSMRRRAERTVRTREATLRTSYERIRQLAGRLITAQESTRAAIAREFHDGLGQELVALAMAAASVKRSSARMKDAQTQAMLSQLVSHARGVVDQVRRLSHDLHPASLRLAGLPAALKAHCVEVEQRFDVQVSFASSGDLDDLHPDVALCLFRIAQEALRNGAVHGRARRLAVTVTKDAGGDLELVVSDDGGGFDLEAVRQGTGLGLVSMGERAHLIGGDLHIATSPGEGTTIHLRVPAATMTTPGPDERNHEPADLPGPEQL